MTKFKMGEQSAKTTKKSQTNTYGELILGLPGDSMESHSQSLRDLVNMGLSIIRMYQLILLPQTAMNTMESREKYEMKTLYRLMPRSYGRYILYDETLTAIEYEEICIANNTMPFEDYLVCRRFSLIIESFTHSVFAPMVRLITEDLNISVYDFVKGFGI